MINTARSRILERLRAAKAGAGAAPPADNAGDAWFTPIPDPLTRFEQECEANRTELHVVPSHAAAPRLEALLRSCLPGDAPLAGSVFMQSTVVLRQLAAHFPADLQRRLRWSDTSRVCDADLCGVTEAEALVARTGSVLISARCGGRAGSVLPPCHLVVAARSQLVAELDEALGSLPPRFSMYSLITGPSRTSDIEKKLVLGAHGPRRLAILLRQ